MAHTKTDKERYGRARIRPKIDKDMPCPYQFKRIRAVPIAGRHQYHTHDNINEHAYAAGPPFSAEQTPHEGAWCWPWRFDPHLA